jgi:vancomycin resistance protein YoaR
VSKDPWAPEGGRTDVDGAVGDADAPTVEFRLDNPAHADVAAGAIGGKSHSARKSESARKSRSERTPDAERTPGSERTRDAERTADSVRASDASGRGARVAVRDNLPFWQRGPVLIAGSVFAGLVIVYVIAYAVTGSTLARSATVLGVDVGGLSPTEAEAVLNAELPEIVDQPIQLSAEINGESVTASLVPSESGLTIDVPATVDAVPGAGLNPISLVRALFGGGETVPVPAVDDAALSQAVAVLADQFDVEPVNGSVAFENGEVITSAASAGAQVDAAATAELLSSAYFGADDATTPIGPVTPVISSTEPSISDEEVAQAVQDFAEPAMSAPVIVQAGDQTIELTPEIISAGLMMSSDSGTLTPELDVDALAEAAAGVLDEVGEPGHDATIEVRGGEPVIIPEESGSGVVPEDLAAAVLPALSETGSARTASVAFDEIQPDFTAADAEALGVTEVISEFTTTFAPTSYRNTNIGLAAQKIDNTLLLPGDTFSLNGLVGERTEARGFARGGVISGGKLIESVGGGVSQVATTTYHAAYQAGLEDVEHKPHSIYYSHYPVGAEATVSWGNFDMAFRNDTPYGVLVETIFTPSMPNRGVLTVRLWSTEYFDVETSTSERYNFTDPPPARYSQASDCVNNSPSRGFGITTYRKVSDPDGNLVKDESYPWSYNPSPEVICGPEPDKDGDD